MRYRIFGANDSALEPAPFLQHLRDMGFDVTASFRADDQGWFEAELRLSGEDDPIKLERFLSGEEGVRTELHSWIAWLETIDSQHQDRLIRHLVGTKQILTIPLLSTDDPEDPRADLGLAVCRYLAVQTEGVYQVDGQGLFAPDGTLLVREV
jgi:hypothetical protein